MASGSSTAGGSGAVGGKSPGLLMSLGINLIRLAVSWRWRPHRARHYDIPLINAYQWSKALLRLQGGEAMAEVDRLEADSKFFRSIVVLTLFTALFAVLSLGFKLGTSGPSPSPSAAVGLALGALLLGRLSFARFSDQRKKAAHRAFHLVLTLDAVKPLAPRAAKKKKPTEADDGGDEAEAA